VLLLLAIHLLAVFGLLAGYPSRAGAVVAGVLAVSLMIRNPLINKGGETLSCLLLFWAGVLSIADCFSVDAAMSPQQPAYRHLSVATVGALLQALYVYFFGSLLKTGPEWASGAAVYWAMHVETTATHLAHWVRQFAWITYPLTYFVLW